MRIYISILVCFVLAILVVRKSGHEAPSPNEKQKINSTTAAATAEVSATATVEVLSKDIATDDLPEKIETLEKETGEVKHALEMQGFPKILDSDRLSENERAEILKKLSQLNDMEIRLVRMKNRQIEKETSL